MSLMIHPDRAVQIVMCGAVFISVGLQVLGVWKLLELVLG